MNRRFGPSSNPDLNVVLRVLPAGGLQTLQGTSNLAGSYGEAITFTRASSATMINSDGRVVSVSTNVPRIEPAGLLMEKAAENVALRSEEFDNATWQKIGVGGAAAPSVVANAAMAPDGTMTADVVTFGAVSATPSTDDTELRQTITYTAAAYSQSVWLRTLSGTAILYIGGSGAGGDTTRALVTTTWQRFKQENKTMTAAARNFHIGLNSFEAHQLPDLPLPAQTVCVWGAQSELGAHITSYIPTTTAAVTRAIDVATTALPTGTSVTEGAAAVTVQPQWTGAAPATSFYLDFEATVNNRRIGYVTAATDLFQAYNGTVNPGVASGYTAGTPKRYLTQWSGALNKFRCANLASGAVNDTAFTTFPAFDTPIYLGSAQSGAFAANGNVSDIVIYSAAGF